MPRPNSHFNILEFAFFINSVLFLDGEKKKSSPLFMYKGRVLTMYSKRFHIELL